MEPKLLDILYVGTLPPHPGGSAVVGEYILQGLADRGHRVRALAPVTPDAQLKAQAFTAQHRTIDVNWFPVPYFSNATDAGSTDAVYQVAERSGIATKLAGILSARRPNVLILGRESIASHEILAEEGRAFRSVVLVHGGITFTQLTGNTPEAHRLLARLRSMDLVVAVAHHLADTLGGLGVSKVRTIPNPVDLDRFTPAPKDTELLRELEIEPDRIVVLHVSRLTAVKRPLDLVAAARNALGRDPRLIYLIVGDGPSLDGVKDACARSGLLGAFRFSGWREHDTLPRFFNLADLVVMPSESEGQSLACLEAQACARCVLASDIPASREIITDGETGLLFNKGDIDLLTQKMLWAAANPTDRLRVGQRARVAAEAHAVETIVTQYENTLLENVF